MNKNQQRRFFPQSGSTHAGAALTLELLAAALTTCAAYPLYETWRIVFVSAAALASAALLTVNTRISLWIRSLLSIPLLTFLATVSTHTFSQLLTDPLRSFTETMTACVTAWKQMLTVDPPFGAHPTTLIPFFVAIFIPALFARKRNRFWPYLPVFPLLWIALFSREELSSTWQIGVINILGPHETFLAFSGFLLVLLRVKLREHEKRAKKLERAAQTVLPLRERILSGKARTMISFVFLTVFATGILTSALQESLNGNRFVLREQIEPYTVVHQQVSPLSLYRLSKTDAEYDRDLFTVTSEGILPERLRLVTLNSYDGREFSVGKTRYKRILKREQASDASTVRITAESDFTQPWIPLPDRMTNPPQFEGENALERESSFYINAGTGDGILTKFLQKNDSYTIEAGTIAFSGGEESGSGFAFDAGHMPNMGEWLRAQGSDDIRVLVERLRNGGYVSHSLSPGRWSASGGVEFFPSRGGHSIRRIEQLFAELNAAPSEIAAAGDDEQFAAAAALLARSLGYESRIVLGFRTQETIGSIPPCERGHCAGKNLAAWLEIRSPQTDNSWETLDVSPQALRLPKEQARSERNARFLSESQAQPDQRVDTQENQSETSDHKLEEESAGGESLFLQILVLILKIGGGVLFLVLVVFAIPLIKIVRRKRRRRRKNTRTQILGAWQELRDCALDSGIECCTFALRNRGSARNIRGGSRRAQAEAIGSEEARYVAEIADRVLFSHSAVLECSYELSAQVWGRVPRRRGLRQWYSLRSLRYARRGGAAAESLKRVEKHVLRGARNTGTAAARKARAASLTQTHRTQNSRKRLAKGKQ